MNIEKIELARLKYKPERIKLLLIAEAPPDDIQRFFYYEDVHERDYLFLGIVEAISPDVKTKYIDSNRNPKVKRMVLEWLKELGVYLIDLSDKPIHGNRDDLPTNLPSLIAKVKSLINDDTVISLVKVNVYDTAFDILNKKFNNVVNLRIDFPSSGNQKKFQEKFTKVLELAELK